MKLRPKVIFDATNPEHRKAYYDFIETSTWSNSPFRFDVKSYGNTKGLMDRQLLSYYLSNEFNTIDS